MTILTQDKVLVNYDNVISIQMLEVEGETDNHENVKFYEVSAKTIETNQAIPNDEPSNVITLGSYSTKNKLLDAVEQLMNSLKLCSYDSLFEMPDDNFEDYYEED